MLMIIGCFSLIKMHYLMLVLPVLSYILLKLLLTCLQHILYINPLMMLWMLQIYTNIYSKCFADIDFFLVHVVLKSGGCSTGLFPKQQIKSRWMDGSLNDIQIPSRQPQSIWIRWKRGIRGKTTLTRCLKPASSLKKEKGLGIWQVSHRKSCTNSSGQK